MITFLTEAFRNMGQTGSLVESSIFLSRKMIKTIDFSRSLNVVELGAGTGVITRFLLDAMGRTSRMTTFEINPILFGRLKLLKDKRLVKVNDNVLTIPEYIQAESVDHIVSSLPLANIPIKEKLRMMNSCFSVLKSGGSFIQFQYSLNDLKLIQKKFPSVKVGFTLLNFPPAFVYYAIKP